MHGGLDAVAAVGGIGRCQPDPDRGAWRRGLCSWPHRRRLRWISRRATVIRSGQLWPLIRLWRGVDADLLFARDRLGGGVAPVDLLEDFGGDALGEACFFGGVGGEVAFGPSSPSAMYSRGALSWGYSGMCSWSHKRRLKWISRRATVTRLGQLLPSRRL